jgi:L-methionine (R)-S-oxide reductase
MPISSQTSRQLLAELKGVAAQATSAEKLMGIIVRRLNETVPAFNWTGFYMLDETHTLVLGPYVGAPTPHTRIPLNQGICGAAASSGQTIVVGDVRSDPRYLACSLETQSEIVAPIFAHGKVVGELDIDSHLPDAFGENERQLVEACAEMVGQYFEGGGAR